MSKIRVTSRQVANHAGVSQTTVSFVLNNVTTANISEETRQRVLQAAQELGYVPDAAARSLASGKSSNIGLILVRPHQQVFGDTFISSIVGGISGAINTKGFRILIDIVPNQDVPGPFINMVKGNEVAGMVVVLYNPTRNDLRQLISLHREEFPVVVVGKALRHLYSVSIDHLDGVRRVVAHLAGLGHRRIGCITYAPLDKDAHAERRFGAFQEALATAGIPFDPALVQYGAYTPDTGYEAMICLLENRPYPTAVFAMNDAVAFGAMRAIQEKGLQIPDDIAIIGYDDIPITRYTTPPLTTVHAPDIEEGRLAGEMLLNLIMGKPVEHQVRLETTLVERGSC